MKPLRSPVILSAIAVAVTTSSAFAQQPPAAAESVPPASSDVSSTAAATPATPEQPRGTNEQPQTAAPPPEVKPEAKPTSWFVRPPLEFTSDKDGTKWKLTIYGFAEFDGIHDSTRSFGDSQGGNMIAKPGTFAADHGRTQFTARNSRFGFKVQTPEIDGIKSTGVLEFDLMASPGAYSGNTLQPNSSLAESTYLNTGVLRTRHAYVKVESPIIDGLAGQTYYLFGGQPYFFPCAAEFLGLPNMVFGRTTQVRLSKTIKTAPVTVDIAVAAQRPPQRDSSTPEGEGMLRIAINDWKGIHTPGSGGTTADALAIGVSGSVRKFQVNSLVLGAPTATVPADTGTQSTTGWGLALNALIPVIPAKDPNDRGNKLSLTGEFTTGSGDADLLNGQTGGIGFQNPPNPMMTNPAPTYINPNVDSGLVTFNSSGALKTIDWTTFIIGAQYYLPPNGRLFISGNYSHGKSGNIVDLAGGKSASVMKDSTFFDGNIFFDLTPAVRLGFSYHVTRQHYGDDALAVNKRAFGAAYFFF